MSRTVKIILVIVALVWFMSWRAQNDRNAMIQAFSIEPMAHPVPAVRPWG